MSGWEVRCMCGWEKDGYKNPYAALYGWEAHLKYMGCASQVTQEELHNLLERTGEQMTIFKGKTEDASAPILGAKYWAKGCFLSGVVFGEFNTANGPCYNIKLNSKIKVDGGILKPPQDGKVELEQVSIGSMAGFEMALRAAGVAKLLVNDKISIKCTGTSPTDKGNDMVNFYVEIDRPEF